MSNRIFSKLKSQTGSMAVYVLVVLLTFLIILVIVYSQIMLARRTQLSTDLKVKDAYEKDYLKANLVYSEQLKKYVTKGLIAQFDGTNNTGDGHNSSASRWENLIGDNNNGTFHGTTIRDNYVSFDGVDDYVDLGQINGNSAITLEVAVRLNELGKTHTLLGNWETGGGGLAVNSTGNFYLQEYIRKTDNSSGYQQVTSSEVLTTDQIYHIVGTYDGKTLKLYLNGKLIKFLALEGTMVDPQFNNPMALGINVDSSIKSYTNPANMNVYACRIYNRALTEEEVQHNYNADKINCFVYADQLKNYVPNGLIVQLDGTNNTGSGHSGSATTWKNLSGNNNDGTFHSATIKDNYVAFDGVDDYVDLGQIKGNSAITLEVTVKLNALVNRVQNFIGNWETGGGGLFTDASGHLCFNEYIKATSDNSSAYRTVTSSEVLTTGQIYHIVGTYDGKILKLYLNGKLIQSLAVEGTMLDPHSNNVMALGTNVNPGTTNADYANMNLYSCRIYNRALAPDEVQHNYNVDKLNYIKN